MKTKAFIKKLYSEVNIPKYKTPGSSGLDIKAFINKDLIIKPLKTALVPTGISVAVEENMEIQIRPRSGLAVNNKITVLNTPGTIDSDYRGEIKVILINFDDTDFVIKNGDRIAQMIVCPIVKIDFELTDELPNTLRGMEGFGSTGKN